MSVDLAIAGLAVAPIGMHRRLLSRRDRRMLTASDIRDLANRVLPDGKQKIADSATRRKLQAIDRSCRFSPEAVVIFQDLLARLGVTTARPIELPVNDVPFWHRTPNPLANYQSTPQLPPMSRSLLNIAKRSLLRLMLSSVGLASKHAAGGVSGLARFQGGT